jgi:DNA polymerase V
MQVKLGKDITSIERCHSHMRQPLPLYQSKISAGFQTPVEESIDELLDLNEHLIPHPSATFFLRVSGDSMQQAHIQSGDLLIVDRSVQAKHQSIVIAAVNGELTVKRLDTQSQPPMLKPEHPDYPPIVLNEHTDYFIWGVVTHVIHKTQQIA